MALVTWEVRVVHSEEMLVHAKVLNCHDHEWVIINRIGGV